MKPIALLVIFLFNSMCFADTVEDVPSQSTASFEAAIRNKSTAPSYVLITIVDARSGETRSACTTANFLLGAIHLESGIEYDRAGISSVELIALSNTRHTFRFTKPEALANVPFRYSQFNLAVVRAKLQNFTVEQLREGFSGYGNLNSLYAVSSWELHAAYRDATACILIEKGLSPVLGDRSGQLRIAP